MEEQRVRDPDTGEISYTNIHSNVEGSGLGDFLFPKLQVN